MNISKSEQQALLLMTEAGAEKRCLACREYWPLDAVFFEPAPLHRDGYSVRCLACIKEKFWGLRR